jgi:hypothetical protein
MSHRSIVLVLALALTACGSSPRTQFYTLDTEPGAGQMHPARPKSPVAVGHVELPATLDRLWMVRKGSGNAIEISDVDRWAAPLDELMRNALIGDLRSRLSPAAVLAPGDTVPADARTVTVNVLHFMADQSGRVVLDADWNIQHGNRRGAPQHAEIAVAGSGGSGGAVASAMSQAVGQLADHIATAL